VTRGVGRGVGAAVTRGVGAAVTRGVGAAVTRGVGAAVTAGVGAAVTTGVGAGVTTGAVVGVVVAVAVAVAAGFRGGTDEDAEGSGTIDGDALATGGTLDDGSMEDCPAGGDAGASVAGASVGAGVSSGIGVGIAAMSVGRLDVSACCWSSTPPMPSAIVASTRFRTPRLRMSRTR
jgi:hypothetical protein